MKTDPPEARLTKLTPAQLQMLKHLVDPKENPAASFMRRNTKWQREQTVRALIGKGLITPVGWNLTDLGRAAIAKAEGQ